MGAHEERRGDFLIGLVCPDPHVVLTGTRLIEIDHRLVIATRDRIIVTEESTVRVVNDERDVSLGADEEAQERAGTREANDRARLCIGITAAACADAHGGDVKRSMGSQRELKWIGREAGRERVDASSGVRAADDERGLRKGCCGQQCHREHSRNHRPSLRTHALNLNEIEVKVERTPFTGGRACSSARTLMLPIEEGDGWVRFDVRVAPRSSRDAVLGEYDGALKIALRAPPVEGAANLALVEFLAKELGVAKRDVVLVRGESSRTKRIEVRGVDAGAVRGWID